MIAGILFLLALATEQHAQVLTGLEVVSAENFKIFQGKKIGLITNHTAVDRQGRHIADLIHQAPGVQLKALFGPEHGIRGAAEAGEKIVTQIDAKTGVPIHSLYGKTYKPTREMLAGLDALVFDMQDVGARFYTYISTMALALEAAAENDLEFYVLDRPNPISGRVEGPVLETQYRSFVGIHAIALRHGMTIGELAQMFVGEGWAWRSSLDSGAAQRPSLAWNKLRVVTLQNWSRQQFFHETQLPWIAPSPNMINEATALLYPGMGLLEGTNFSEGRGTSQPFELVGAPWLDSETVAALLRENLAGVEIETVTFTPQDLPGKAMNPKFEGELCHGLRFKIIAPEKVEAVKLGMALLWALQKTHPGKLAISEKRMARMFGAAWLREMLLAGADLQTLGQRLDRETEAFRALREKYLLYKD
ncbi:MAG: DUF1343 domain-containing protein [candidate division KSB1 bacterium]